MNVKDMRHQTFYIGDREVTGYDITIKTKTFNFKEKEVPEIEFRGVFYINEKGEKIRIDQKKEEIVNVDIQKERDEYCKLHGHEIYTSVLQGCCFCKKCGKKGTRDELRFISK